MNGNSVREIPIVPRREAEDTRMTRDQYEVLMNSPSGGQMSMYQTASVTDTLGRDDDEAEGCVCDEALEAETDDEDLPEALVPGLDRSPRAPRDKK